MRIDEDVAQSELRAHNLTNDGGLMVVDRAQMGHRWAQMGTDGVSDKHRWGLR